MLLKDEPEFSVSFDALGSNLVLPKILLPTRITEDFKTYFLYCFKYIPLTSWETFVFQSLTVYFNYVFLEQNQIVEMVLSRKTGHNSTKIILSLTSMKLTGTLFLISVSSIIVFKDN